MAITLRVNNLTLVLALCVLTISSCTPVPAIVSPSPTASQTYQFTQSPTLVSTQTPWIITTTPQEMVSGPTLPQGTFILSLPDGGYFHLFAYSPEAIPLARITANNWDDIEPAYSPNGNLLAYSSRQNGYWDLFVLDLLNGGTRRLTDTPECDSAPSWSPDGAWLVHETCGSGSLELVLTPVVDTSAGQIQLTFDNFLDTSPVWSPADRQIAFISDRSGEMEVWIVVLDNTLGNQFINISRSPETIESHPAWSPDGTRLAWASNDPSTGLTGIWSWDARTPDSPPTFLASGDWPVWQDSTHLATRLLSPTQTLLAGYQVPTGLLSLPPVLLPGDLQGLTYAVTSSPFQDIFLSSAQITPAPLYIQSINNNPDSLPGRTSLVDLPGIQAAYPQLSDVADDAFAALRNRVAIETGWDALASLENAYVPLTTPLDPGLDQDWLYTGRAFSLNPALIQAGWMVIVREDFGLQTWWRIYLRTTAQDGSLGQPLRQLPWDFTTRTGSSKAYENGGSLISSVPAGYWVDLTTLASVYGWERLPSLTNWRTFYAGARFNELAFINDSTWQDAMLELYPFEALITPTVVIPPTRTPTRTPLWFRSPTPTRTPTPRPTSTP